MHLVAQRLALQIEESEDSRVIDERAAWQQGLNAPEEGALAAFDLMVDKYRESIRQLVNEKNKLH